MLSDGRRPDTTDVRVVFSWHEAGPILLDADGKLRFPEVPPSPGVYRMTLTAPSQTRPRVYFGEAQMLPERLRAYRNPGGRNSRHGQRTNIRVNDELRALLASGGEARLAYTTAVTVSLGGAAPAPLDLWVEGARLLAENAALVTAQLAAGIDHMNL